MKMVKVVYIINTVVTGILAALAATFLAGGAIGENYTDKTWVAPEFFLILPIWALGVLVGLFLFKKKHTIAWLLLSILVTWASVPVGFRIAVDLALGRS